MFRFFKRNLIVRPKKPMKTKLHLDRNQLRKIARNSSPAGRRTSRGARGSNSRYAIRKNPADGPLEQRKASDEKSLRDGRGLARDQSSLGFSRITTHLVRADANEHLMATLIDPAGRPIKTRQEPAGHGPAHGPSAPAAGAAAQATAAKGVAAPAPKGALIKD